MAKISFTPELQASYQRLFDTCMITPDKYPLVDYSVKMILKGRARYEAVSKITNVPWYFIGIAHHLEGGSKFDKHLHNGDPLTGRTTHVPKGRPVAGNPPFTWEASAEDALAYTGVNQWTNWTIPGLLYKLEAYNGFGYRRPSININSPYLWGFSNHYTKGKFVLDGTYSPTAVSKQAGAAVIVRRLMEKKEIEVEKTVSRTDTILELGNEVVYAPSRYSAKVEELQKVLNLNGAYLKVDGKAGKMTSDAFKSVSGKYLMGDPRLA